MKNVVIVVFMVLSLALGASARAAAPGPGTPAWRAGCPSTVTARFPWVTLRYACFSADSRIRSVIPGLTHIGLYLTPAEEKISLDGEAKPYGAGDGEMSLYFSSAPDCHYGQGVTFKLSDPCLLILSQAGFASWLPHHFEASHGFSEIIGYLSGCKFKGGWPLVDMVFLPCRLGPKSDRTAGSITFTRWATRPGGHFAFRFSAGAQVTGFYVNKSLATVTVAVPLAGAASGIID